MHPAPSVILFTTASGLGFGMMALLGLGFGPTGTVSGPLTAFIAFVLAGGGLAASTFHLGNPQRASPGLHAMAVKLAEQGGLCLGCADAALRAFRL